MNTWVRYTDNEDRPRGIVHKVNALWKFATADTRKQRFLPLFYLLKVLLENKFEVFGLFGLLETRPLEIDVLTVPRSQSELHHLIGGKEDQDTTRYVSFHLFDEVAEWDSLLEVSALLVDKVQWFKVKRTLYDVHRELSFVDRMAIFELNAKLSS